MPIFIPPGGFIGFGQQTAAVQALLRSKSGGAVVRRKKRTTKKRTRKPARRKAAPKRARRATRRTTRGGKPARLVKGSAAAKRHMAKLRKMRRKR